MENADGLVSSMAPQRTWNDFLDRMRQPSASEFVKSIKSFIVSFSHNSPDPERDSAAVQQFLSNMEAAFRAHPLWDNCSEDELDSAGEGLEKYVMSKLFTRVFASIPDDAKYDENLSEKMALLQQFIRPENLDIKPNFQNETSWLLAQKELQKINMVKAPRDKLICILSCCKVINNILIQASIASNENPPGADEFLPVLIFVTIKANPPQLHSNLLYIQRFRRQSRLVSEAAYFFTNMLSAESFISNIDAKSISMEETEFKRNMETARELLSGLSGKLDAQSDLNDQKAVPVSHKQLISKKEKDQVMGHPLQSSELKNQNEEVLGKEQLHTAKLPHALSISDLENKGASMLLKEDEPRGVFQDYPYLYAQVGDLTISDVEDLLKNYKQIVFKYVCLSKGLGVPTQSLATAAKETEGTSAVGMSSEKPEDSGRIDESFAGASRFEAESSESKLADDVVAVKNGDDGEISQ